MTAAAERTALLAAVSVVLRLCVGRGGAFLSAEWLHLYTAALALPIVAQGLSEGLRWRAAAPMNKKKR